MTDPWKVFDKLADAQALCDSLNKAGEYPRRGTDVHGKPVGPDRYEPGAYGWTEGYTPTPDEKGTRWAVAIAEQDEVRAESCADAKAKADVAAAKTTKVPLPADWTTATVEAAPAPKDAPVKEVVK